MNEKRIADELPLVSVVVPCYNHAQWVESCIKSVSEVDYPRIELLLLDDGSSDASFEYAKIAIRKNGVKFERVWIEKQTNQGITKTFNRLVANSCGKYVVPLASDDELTKQGIASCVAYLEQGDNANSLLIINVDVIDETGLRICDTRIDKYSGKLKGHKLFRDIVIFFGTPYQHQIFSRKIFDQVGGYDEGLKYEDLDLALRFVGLGRISVIEEKVKKYRVWRNGATTPGLSQEDLNRTPIYKKNMPLQKGAIWLLFYFKVKGEHSRFHNFISRLLAKMHLLSLKTL